MKSTLPLVSVIVPSYNHEKYVEKTIETILNQTYTNMELIVIDDGSQDSSPEILKRLSDKHSFRFYRQANIGLSATLNRGVRMATGKYVSVTASDDYWELNKIEMLVEEFEKLGDEYALVSGDARFIDEEGNSFKKIKNGNEFDSVLHFAVEALDGFNLATDFGEYETFLQSNYVPVMATLIRRDILLEVGLYDEEFFLEDWSLWFKISKKYKYKYVDSVVASYRVHDKSTVRTMNDRLTRDFLNILVREKNYCYENGFSKIWDKRYYRLLLSMLRRMKLKDFLEYFEIRNFARLLIAATSRW